MNAMRTVSPFYARAAPDTAMRADRAIVLMANFMDVS
jgi:hypothetical protein